MDFDATHILESFGLKIEFNVKILSPPKIKLTQEMEIICFNLQVQSKLNEYHCVINSSNSWLGIANYHNVLHYIHFPRKYRLWNDIHNNGLTKIKQKWYRPIHDSLMRIIYTLFDRKTPSHVIANSNFTATAISHLWKQSRCDIIYPPLNEKIIVTKYEDWKQRSQGYVVLGRFSHEKGQLQLMKQIKKYSGIFHFIGFADTHSSYYKQCKKQADSQKNIRLHPNLSNEARNKVLGSVRYYVHTTINEPFGLSIIESLSQGLLPIIHSSGGAKEIITESVLQYQQMSDLPILLDSLLSTTDIEKHELLSNIQLRCNKLFGMDSFTEQFRSQLSIFDKLEI